MTDKKLIFDVFFDGTLLGRVPEEDRHDLVNEHLDDQGIVPSEIAPGMIEYDLVKIVDNGE